MISFELAERLKKAGFQQFGDGNALVLYPKLPEQDEGERPMASIPWGQYIHLRKEGNPEVLYAPTLEELIGACGTRVQDFNMQRRFIGGTYGVTWLAVLAKYENSALTEKWGEGQTPTEAVARLWLALNAKSVNNSQ